MGLKGRSLSRRGAEGIGFFEGGRGFGPLDERSRGDGGDGESLEDLVFRDFFCRAGDVVMGVCGARDVVVGVCGVVILEGASLCEGVFAVFGGSWCGVAQGAAQGGRERWGCVVDFEAVFFVESVIGGGSFGGDGHLDGVAARRCNGGVGQHPGGGVFFGGLGFLGAEVCVGAFGEGVAFERRRQRDKLADLGHIPFEVGIARFVGRSPLLGVSCERDFAVVVNVGMIGVIGWGMRV